MGIKNLDFNISDKDMREANKRRFAGYSKSLKLYSESLASEGIDVKGDYRFIIEDKTKSEEYKAGMMQPLFDDRKALTEKIMQGSLGDSQIDLYKESLELVNADIAFLSDRFDTSMKLISESANGNNLAVNQQTVLPLQYLEAMSTNARLITPFKNTDQKSILRQRVVKKIHVDGKDYRLPDAFLDSEVLEKILGASNLKRTVSVNSVTQRNIGLLETFFPEAQTGVDSLSPIMTVKSVTVAAVVGGDPDVKLQIPTNTHAAKATWNTRGKFSLVVKEVINETTKETRDHHISGELNFATGVLKHLASTEVKSIEVELSLYGGTNNRTFRTSESREDHMLVVDEYIAANFTYNMVAMHDKLTLENVDGLMAATAIIYDTAVHVKDYYIFKELDNYWSLLTDKSIPAGLNEINDGFKATVDLSPSNAGGDGTNYRPTDPISWRQKMIPEGMATVATSYRDKLNSRDGYKAVFWSNPLITRLANDSVKSLIKAGQEYGGIQADSNVSSGSIDGQPIRIVSTQRVDKNVSSFKSIAISNDANEETFTFYQSLSIFNNDGKIRDPKNIAMPTVSYYDSFQLDAVHVIMGEVELVNKEAAHTTTATSVAG